MWDYCNSIYFCYGLQDRFKVTLNLIEKGCIMAEQILRVGDIRKTNTSYGKYAIDIDVLTAFNGYTRTVEQPKFFWTLKEAKAFKKLHSNT